MSINKWFRDIASATAIMLSCISVSWANSLPNAWDDSDCAPSPAGGIHFAYFNGANTTKFKAEAEMVVLETRFGEKYPLEGPGDPIEYVLYYNKTDGLKDFLEIFEQRAQEADSELAKRWELLWDFTASPKPTDGWMARLLEGSPTWMAWEIELLLESLVDSFASNTGAGLAELILGNEPDSFESYEEHRRQLDAVLVEGKKVVMFASSQGNNFVRGAYKYAMEDWDRPANSVKVIHVGSASKIKIPGSYWVLNQYDIVIATLNKFIEWPEAPNIAYTPWGPNALPSPETGGSDPLGHLLLEIYSNPAYHQESFLRASVFDAFATVEPGPDRGAPETCKWVNYRYPPEAKWTSVPAESFEITPAPRWEDPDPTNPTKKSYRIYASYETWNWTSPGPIVSCTSGVTSNLPVSISSIERHQSATIRQMGFYVDTIYGDLVVAKDSKGKDLFMCPGFFGFPAMPSLFPDYTRGPAYWDPPNSLMGRKGTFRIEKVVQEFPLEVPPKELPPLNTCLFKVFDKTGTKLLELTNEGCPEARVTTGGPLL